MSRPRLLLLDEPTAGLDPTAADGIDELITQLNDALGITVVVVTHDLNTLFSVCDRVALLAERLDHHPDWSNSWNRVTIELISHDKGSITERDRTMATGINTLVA